MNNITFEFRIPIRQGPSTSTQGNKVFITFLNTEDSDPSRTKVTTISLDSAGRLLQKKIYISYRYALGNTEKFTNHINFLPRNLKLSLNKIIRFIRLNQN